MSTPVDGTVFLLRALKNATPSQIIYTLIVALLVRYFGRAIYRVYFHPLSRFPGPKLSAATRWPHTIAVYQGRMHTRVAELHRQYGDIVRISVDEVSFIGPDAWRDTQGRSSRYSRGSMPTKHFARYGKPVHGARSMHIATSDEDHARMRRIFVPAFSDRALKQQEPLFMKYADFLVHQLKAGLQADPGRKFDMGSIFHFTTFDIMGDLTFGEPLHMLEKMAFNPWVSVIFSTVKATSRVGIIMHYPWLWSAFKALYPKKQSENRAKHFQHSVDRVTKRLEKGRDSEGVDLWDLVLKQPDVKSMTRGEMDANASLFMVAGTETTASVMSGWTFLLLKNPEYLKKLTDEIRGAFSSESEITMEALAPLPYLNSTMKEALRLYPPVAIGLHRLTPADGSTICGEYIPPNTTVSVPHYAAYTNERNFKDPLSYIPERWMGDERFDGDNKAVYQPFTYGPRDCLGKNMALHEMRLVMSKLMYNFDLELCPESANWSDQKVFTFWEKIPLMLKLKPVER